MKEALKLLKKLKIDINEYIVIACSYGPDSMALLHFLASLNYKIVVAHVNHKKRVESDEEYSLMEKYCQDNNFIFEGMCINQYNKSNFESEARDIRYDFFERILNKYNSKYLFTAHHGDDLTETIIMRLLRGSSLKGYSAFHSINDKKNYLIIRPLIYYSKDEIMSYIQQYKIPYAIDSSNLSNVYTRNIIRLEILPILKTINPNVNKKVIKFSEMLNQYNEYIENEVSLIFNKTYKNNSIDLNEFYILPILIKKRLLEHILFFLYKENITKIDSRHIDLILNLTENNNVNKSINLPNNIIVSKFYNILEFSVQNNKSIAYNYIIEEEITVPTGIIKKIDNTNIDKSNYIIRLNSNEVSMPLHVRNRHNGDRMEIKNLNGSKKVKAILIDSKIDKNLKNIIPILTDSDDNILWIPGVKKSTFDKQKDQSYDIILKYIQKGGKDEE